MTSLNNMRQKFVTYKTVMEKSFEKLRRDGKNDVDHLVQWMSASKIIDEQKAKAARDLFKDVANKRNVEFGKFKAVLSKLATDRNKTMEEFTIAVALKGEKFMEALTAAATAFKDTMKKK